MEFYSCPSISSLSFVIQGRIDTDKSGISFCCREDLKQDIDGNDMDFPIIPLDENPVKTLQHFISMHNKMLEKGKWGGAEGIERDPKFACYHCGEWRKANWAFSSLIQTINLSMVPSPCQCHCFYCDVHKKYNHFHYDDELKKIYEKAFEVLNLAKRQRIIAPVGMAHWQLSSGEIAIHPYRKEMLDLVRGENVSFFTNGFIFDEGIARELHDNPMADINISIDSGTAETWHKVKGVNNFQKVLENLVNYRKCSCRPGQITVKYIVLPGVNDSDKDFGSCVNILKALDVTSFFLSRDIAISRSIKNRDQSRGGEILDEAVVYSAARLLAMWLFATGISPVLHGTYTLKERETIIRLANNMLSKI